jgi:hypothetical protein
LVVAVVLAAGCGGGHSRRDEVEAYIKDVNAVERDAGPSFAKANAAYARFARGQIGEGELTRLRRAEVAIRDAKVRLTQLDPPGDAHRLSMLILDLYDADANFAHETSLLAAYLPQATKVLQPLGPVNGRLQRGLNDSSGTGARAASVLRRYARDVRRIAAGLRALNPPPLLERAHNARIRRLAKTAGLADSLRLAVQRRDSAAVARQLLRFQRLGATKAPQGLTPDVIQAYDKRYDAIRRKAAAVSRESVRLDKAFGGSD